MKIIYELFSCFTFCRRRLGGTWYQVYREWDDGIGPGTAASVVWTQEKPTEYVLGDDVCQILKTETY